MEPSTPPTHSDSAQPAAADSTVGLLPARSRPVLPLLEPPSKVRRRLPGPTASPYSSPTVKELQELQRDHIRLFRSADHHHWFPAARRNDEYRLRSGIRGNGRN